MSYQKEIGLLLATAAFGSAIAASKAAINCGLNPNLYMLLRYSGAFIILTIVFHRRLRSINKKIITAGALMGCATGSAFILQTLSLNSISVAKAGFFGALYVVFVPLIESILKHKMPSKKEIVGVILSIIGLFVMSFQGEISFGLGELLAVGSAIGFSAGIILVGRYAAIYDPIVLTIVFLPFSAIIALIFAVIGGVEGTVGFSFSAFAVILYAIIGGTAIPSVLNIWAQKKVSPTKAAIILVLEPVFAGILAWIFLHESMTVNEITGAVVMLAGMLISSKK